MRYPKTLIASESPYLQECEECGDFFGLGAVQFNGVKMLCKERCLDKWRNSDTVGQVPPETTQKTPG